MRTNNQKGFTLIELLVVIAIIGLLSTLAIVALNSARTKSRDAKRVSDIKQIQTALELYFADQDSYPVGTSLTLGSAAADVLDSTNGFDSSANGTVYMGLVPSAPVPPAGNAYTYSSLAARGGAACVAVPCGYYTLTFVLEDDTGSLKDSDGDNSPECTADPDGITCV